MLPFPQTKKSNEGLEPIILPVTVVDIPLFWLGRLAAS
jgi:hypothetical protein